MPMKRRRASLLFVCAALSAIVALPVSADTPAPARPDGVVFTVKGGALKLVDDTQTIDGTPRQFDDSSTNVLALELERRFRNENAAIGGELMRYSSRYRDATVAASDFDENMHALSVLMTGKYFFGDGHTFEPYVAGGVGLALAHDEGGPIRGLAVGLGVKGALGLQLRSDRLGVRVELFQLFGRPDDERGDEIDVSVRGVMVGATFFFGPRRSR
jgi:hypothetical protein